jgi:hypothetical protein
VIKANFVVEDNKVDWASDYTQELNNFADLMVKDVLAQITKMKIPGLGDNTNKETKDYIKNKIKEKYGIV